MRPLPSAQPSSADPLSAQPPSANPSSAQPSSAQPSSAQPSSVQPSSAQPSSAQPSSAQPSSQSSSEQQSPAHPSSAQPSQPSSEPQSPAQSTSALPSPPSPPSASNPFAASANDQRKASVSRAAHGVTLGLTLLLGLVVAVLFGALLVRAAPALSWNLLWENPTDKGKAGGLWAPLIGTVWLVVLSMALVAPVGVGAAVYLNEYAPAGRVTRAISLAVTSLAGVPSIVHALFGLGAFVLFARLGVSLLAAACTLAVMNLPVVVAASREALAAVPQAFREACWNLGASRWHTLRTVVLPNALGGILTGVILAVSRAAGETAPILFTGGVFFRHIPDTMPARLAPYGPLDPFMALAMHLHVIATQVSQMPPERTFATAVVLVALVLLLNAFAFVLRSRLRKNRKW